MTPDRRILLRAGIGITAAIASRSTPVRAALDAPDVDGEFSFESNACAAAANDFGNIIHRKPRAVLKPASSVDIASVMRWAGDRGLKVAARGQAIRPMAVP